VPAAFVGVCILIRPDYVIATMLPGFGATVSAIEAPSDTEGGAYGRHSQSHNHDH
jgi:urease accessory protein UreE